MAEGTVIIWFVNCEVLGHECFAVGTYTRLVTGEGLESRLEGICEHLIKATSQ